MARWHTALVTVAGAIVLMGCQPQAQLPPPTFTGPQLAPRRAEPTAMPDAVAVVVRPAPERLPHVAPAMPRVPSEWVPQVQARPWRYIVIHHSASPTGGAVAFDLHHRRDNGWDELGYHFVVGNGTNTGNGQIEVGPRWPKQKWGAHAKTPDNRFNDYGIGICLVGDFDVSSPSSAQMRSVSNLVAYLMQTYHIPPERVLAHQDCGKPTACPGRHMSVAEVRRMATQILAEAGVRIPTDHALAQGELLSGEDTHAH